MKKFLFLLLMLSSTLFALERKVRVADSENLPINNVVVKVADRAFLTNEKGVASLTSKSDNDSVFVHKIGFEDITYFWVEMPSNIKLKTKSIELPGITVTSQKNSGNPTLKKMIIRNDTELSNVDNAADLLNNHSEIRLLGSDIAGAEQSVSLLGHQSKHTLVLLDGIPLNSSGQKFDISTIPAEIIESIEIIPQNATATTGAGAIGGAINIITKSEMETESSIMSGISYESGSFGYEAIGTNLKFSHPNYFLDLNYTWQDAENDFEYEYFLTNNPETRKRKNNQYSDNVMNLSLRLNHPLNLKYNLIKQDFRKGLPGPIHQLANYDEAQLTGDVWRHNASINQRYRELFFKLQGFWFAEETEFNNLESTMPTLRQRGENESDKRGIELQTSYKWHEFDWLLELEYRREGFSYKHYNRNDEFIPQTSISDIYQENSAVALTWDWEIETEIFKLTWQTSGRLDRVITTKSKELETSWQTGVDWDFYTHLFPEIKLGYGSSYSLPSFYDLYWVGDSQAQGNPDLKPEYALGGFVELGYDGFWGSIKTGWLKNSIKDLIIWQRGINGWKPHNMNNAQLTNYKIDGVVYPFQILEIGASWLRTISLNKSKNDTGSDYYDKSVINTPRFQTSCYARIKHEDVFMEFSYNRTGRQYTLPDETWPLKAYHTYDLQAGYGLNLYEVKFKFTGKILNVTDEEYNEYSNNPSPGRSWQAGVGFEYVYK